MALGVIDVARFEFGMSIPGDLSVIGFDDIPAAAWPAYALTTVRQPIAAMVAAALRLLTAVPALTSTGTLELLAGELVVRQTSRV
jgi:DNA-binding LacI/PurR family transcriptional regulator